MLRYRDLIGTPKFLPLDQECVPFFTRPSPSRSDGWGLGTRLWGEYRGGWKEVIQRSRAGHNEINRFDHILYIPGTKDKRPDPLPRVAMGGVWARDYGASTQEVGRK